MKNTNSENTTATTTPATVKPLSKAQKVRLGKAVTIEMLKRYLPEGATVYAVLRHVAASGMSRRIDFFTIVTSASHRDTPYMQYLSGWMATALGYKLADGKSGLNVKGCGMDMGFHVVDSLSWTLYGEGGKLRCEWL